MSKKTICCEYFHIKGFSGARNLWNRQALKEKKLFSQDKGQKNEVKLFLDFAKSGGGSPISLAESYSASEVCGSFSFRVGNINIPSPLMGEGAGGGEGLKFRRQEPIGRYIADFVCHERGIVIEVDGGRHSIYKDRDRERDIWLNRQGYEVLRFWNNEVLTHPPLAPPIKGGERCEGSPSREGKDVRDLHQGRGNYPLEMRKN